MLIEKEVRNGGGGGRSIRPHPLSDLVLSSGNHAMLLALVCMRGLAWRAVMTARLLKHWPVRIHVHECCCAAAGDVPSRPGARSRGTVGTGTATSSAESVPSGASATQTHTGVRSC
eukprot:365702-Chlamydomonas_euryale.AAC.7